MPGALDGVQVLEVADYITGPYCGMLLADMGADVIKIEKKLGGDPFRGFVPSPGRSIRSRAIWRSRWCATARVRRS